MKNGHKDGHKLDLSVKFHGHPWENMDINRHQKDLFDVLHGHACI